MIEKLLPGYYAVFGEDPKYKTVRSIQIDGHEVAWMEYEGTTVDGKSYKGRMIFCECDFTEGVGWGRKDGQYFKLGGPEKCLPRAAACHLRSLELRDEYMKRFDAEGWGVLLPEIFPEIAADLIAKVKAGEFIGEDGNGAEFWGGYFYVQTIAGILDCSVRSAWEEVRKMTAQKKISLEGAVIQDYRKPARPKWTETVRVADDGWTGIASLPANRDTPEVWRLKILKPNGRKALSKPVELPLMHGSEFGPDVDDVAAVEAELRKLIASAKAKL